MGIFDSIGPGDDDPGIDARPPGQYQSYADTRFGQGTPVWGDRANDVVSRGGIEYEVPYTSDAAQDVDRYRRLARAAATRSAAPIDYARANQALQSGSDAIAGTTLDRINAANARMQQEEGVGLAQLAAQGYQPSRAELLGRSMLDQGLRSQLAGAASVRGGSLAQAAAARAAAQGSSAYQQQGMQQIAALRADEMERARAQYLQGAGQLRGQDYAGADQALRTGQAYAGIGQIAGQMSQAQAAQDMQMRGLNQAAEQYYESKAFDTRTAKLNAELQGYGLAQGNKQFQTGIEFKRDEANRDMAAAGIGGMTSFGTAMIRAEGGPVAAGKPYIVGERGPELIVPKQNGTVIPADQTKSLGEVIPLYEPPGMQLHQSADGRAFLASAPSDDEDDGRPRLASRTSAPQRQRQASLAAAAMTKSKLTPPQAAPAARRPLTPDELRAAADKLEQQMRAEHEARMAAGPAVRPSLGEYAGGIIRENPYGGGR